MLLSSASQVSLRRELEELIRAVSGDVRIAALRQLLDRPVSNAPGWYLLGVEMVRMADLNAAARAFGMAYHQDIELTSAAVLTFSCLKAARAAHPHLREQFINTWYEMKKPPLGATNSERDVAKLMRPNAANETVQPRTAETFFDQFFNAAEPDT